MCRTRVLVADDHPIVRGGLQQILAATSQFEVVGFASSADEVLASIPSCLPDVLILDISMPGAVGMDLLERVRSAHPKLPVVVLSMHNEGQIVQRALSAGASAYVTKDSDPQVLLAAMSRVMSGARFVDPALLDSVVSMVSGEALRPQELLTSREFKVLKLIAAGYPLIDIAVHMHLSPKTISTHKMRLMQKLGIDNNAELVRYAVRHGIAPN
jgi:DNA-binding NarL/FixJ family response regulator